MSAVSNVNAAQIASAQNAASTTQAGTTPQSGLSAQALEKTRKAAIEFEGMTIGEMLQPMFDTVDTANSLFGGGAAESQFRSLQVLEMGKQIANNGGIGLADSVYRQMLAMQEKAQQEKGTS
ncbi:hypothetical protein ASY01nite_05800 [Acetobacter syzygii]|uniref:rod-binding protein n=1 Tax=Acetobacter syzygii TaxID=146476 RepID=UPI0005E5A8C7|nr:rod-binding protein [Acetobacter syzygii]GAN70597.1 chemotactic signal-response protein CheL [Acetobacter syzygii]GBR65731.1 chemotactic signal-response protein CheL [Acetobacter syzygii NRIC 0483]GEL55514.1 hypothetical protein ASY01nite_05800 [Acetobacter syzygii]